MIEIVDFFSGCALNAVDAKGRVSLPADIRALIEARADSAVRAGMTVQKRTIQVGEHGVKDCLTAFDQSYTPILLAELKQAIDATVPEGERAQAFEDAQVDAMSALEPVSFDDAGRMVLNPYLRQIAGISDLAFFVGAGRTFQIWEPRRFHATQAARKPAIRKLEALMASRGVSL